MKVLPTLQALSPYGGTIAAIDGGKIMDTIQRALTSAGLNTTDGATAGVNNTICRALSSAGIGINAGGIEGREPRGAEFKLIKPVRITPEAASSSCLVARGQSGQFLSRSYSNAAGTRTYKLYIPETCAGNPMPLIVMLHGCTQSPDDFATGTRMNELAARFGFLVVYPAQSKRANGSNCWNWFDPKDQVPERGEPSLIAGITHEVASIYPVDERRIFVAGLSAGAAMAVILGTTYPKLFAAVGAHSGLPYGAAYDVPSAFAAMRGGAVQISRGSTSGRRSLPLTTARRATPTIVFHGDKDTTVSAVNARAIVAQALALEPALKGHLTDTVAERKSINGRECTATIYRGSSMRPLIEQWILHGAGHAWSGGCSDGSYTDPTGPDASAEMVRFFLAQGDQPSHVAATGCDRD